MHSNSLNPIEKTLCFQQDEEVPLCLHQLFERQVDHRPHSPALICGDTILSYQELENKTNQLARHLTLHGVGPGKFVGLYFERSELPIISLLACLKSGATYIPIDPSYPSDRIKHIQEESELILLLTEKALLTHTTRLFSCDVMAVDLEAQEICKQSTTRLSLEESGVTPHHLCYVIYTSGTTGRPKGVMTEHRNASLFTLAFNKICGTQPEDRIFQGFSLTFDGSIEEIWMAFSNGSTLVVGDQQTPRFGNELGQFLSHNQVSYFSTVPTMLSTMTDPIPSLRWLVVSGEICPQELVNRWASAPLRMFNVYGPTETTVNTTAAECFAGQAISIGRALEGYELYILDSNLQPVPHGQKGELFIGGETLARGYLKQPELTAERFITISQFSGESNKRLYRTGDLVRFNEKGELDFFGRIDGQIKIRGYRVELAEIESILMEHEQILSASVKLIEKNDLQELAAYVVLNNPFMPLDRASVLALLESRVPPYMVPGYLDVIDQFPMLTSGKVNRTSLPEAKNPLVRMREKIIEPKSKLESKIAEVWAHIFGLPQVSIEDDFFMDLGGHSLIAAQMVTLLRRQTKRQVTVRDAYNFPTIQKLARHLATITEEHSFLSSEITERQTKKDSARKFVYENLSRSTRLTTTTLQALSIYLLYGIGTVPFVVLFLLSFGWMQNQISNSALIGITLSVLLLAWPVMLTFSIAAKWIIIGRYQVGKYPLWSFYYFRWWLVDRLQGFSGIGSFVGTPIMPLYYRLMGAKVGQNCLIDTAQCSIWDTLSIGDGTSIGADTQLLGYRVEDGQLHIGTIQIGSNCFIGIHSALGLNVQMEDNSQLDDQSLIADHQTLKANHAYRGSPAQPANISLPQVNTEDALLKHPFLFGLAHFVLVELMGVLLVLPALPLIALCYYSLNISWMALVAAMILSIPAGIVLYALYIVVLKRIVLSHANPGVYRTESLFYLRKWMSDQLMKFSHGVLLPLYTTIYFPTWLRMLGAKIGARAELSTVWYFAPELIDVGAESFFADGSIIGGKRFYRGHFQIGLNRIGRRSFVGNSAILPVGASLGDNCLLGVQSIPPTNTSCTKDGTEWLGSPAFYLPHRPKVGNFETSVTFSPTRKLIIQRALIDALRILIPGYIALTAATAEVFGLYFFYSQYGLLTTVIMAPLLGLTLGLYVTLTVVGIKKLVMGTFKPVIKPLWSMYVWLNEMLNGAYESVMTPAIKPYLATPFIAPLLRLMGCKIGRNTYIATTLFSEFDLVEIGDYAALNHGAVIQNHLFEDRVMKSSYLKIGAECSVGNMAVVLYDSEMLPGSCLGPLSLLMKGETTAANSCWHGIPTQLVSTPQSQTSLEEGPQAKFINSINQIPRRISAPLNSSVALTPAPQ